MNEKTQRQNMFYIVILEIVLFLGSTLSFAGIDGDSYKSRESRLDLTMRGGYAHSESISGMPDFHLEIQFSISSRVKTGLGFGYLKGNDDVHMGGNFLNMRGGMMGNMGGGMMGGFSGHSHSVKIIPITLSLYYAFPINPKLDAFILGGGGYYIGSYQDQSIQNQSSFGPHVGLGLNFELSDRIAIIAQGLYRSSTLKGFTSEMHEGFREGMEGEHEDGFWHFHHHEEEWHFHEEYESEQQLLIDAPPFDISLNGISLSVGIKFGF